MIFGGLELLALKPLFAKYVGHHAVSAIASHLAHAPATTIANFAHAAATNVIVSASSAGTAAGAIKSLVAGGKAGKKLYKKVSKIQNKEEMKAMIKDDELNDEEKAELLFAFATVRLVEAYYASLERPKTLKNGKRFYPPELKTQLSDMEPCGAESCSCDDYEEPPDKHAMCKCCHSLVEHKNMTAEQLEDPYTHYWLFRSMAEEVYPMLEHRNASGSLKDSLFEIKACSNCACVDFNWEPGAGFISQYCRCEHRDRGHYSSSEYHWIIELLIGEMIGELGPDALHRMKTKASKNKKLMLKSSGSSWSSSSSNSDSDSDSDSDVEGNWDADEDDISNVHESDDSEDDQMYSVPDSDDEDMDTEVDNFAWMSDSD